MKKLCTHIVLAVLISIGWTVSSQAAEVVPVTSFDSTWAIETYGTANGSVATDGAKINLSSQGSATDYIEKDFKKHDTPGIIGMVATIRVDQATSDSTGSCMIGISQEIGQIGNSKINLLIYLQQSTNKKSTKYRVRTQDLTTKATKIIAQGTFGDTDGGWSIGVNKTVAYALVGTEIWFYAGDSGLMRYQPDAAVTPFYNGPTVITWADKGVNNSISGSVSDIYLIKE